MTNRRRLPQRRASVTFTFRQADGEYRVTAGLFPNGTVGEIFVNCQKAGSSADINAADGAVAASLALQYGCNIDTLRTAMKRNPDGTAIGPLGHALDIVAKEIK